MSSAIVLTALLQGFFSLILRQNLSTDALIWAGTQGPNVQTVYIKNYSDTIALVIIPPVSANTADGRPFIGGSAPDLSNIRNSAAAAAGASATIVYEQNNCNTIDGYTYGPTEASLMYAMTAQYRRLMYCFYASTTNFACFASIHGGSNSGILAAYGQQTYYNGPTYPPNRRYSAVCRDRNYVINPSASVSLKVSKDSTKIDTCAVSSNPYCNSCSWPYLSSRDTIGCGCIVDRNRYQSEDQLKARLYVYCQTYNDGSGTQYYLDQSRSCFNSSTCGVPKGACSNPTNGKTIYMPAQTCPSVSVATGQFGDTLLIDSAKGQPAVYNPDDNPVGTNDTAAVNRLDSILGYFGRGDTGTHNRLDTIINLLRNGSDSGGSGSDTGTHRRLDSLMGNMGYSISDSISKNTDSTDYYKSLINFTSDSLRAQHDSLNTSVLSLVTSDSCWLCTKPPPFSIPFSVEFEPFISIDTTYILDFNSLFDQLPFDFFALIRWIEWISVTIACVPMALYIMRESN